MRFDYSQAKLLREWITNGRRLDRLVQRMEKVSLSLTEDLLHGASQPREPRFVRATAR